MRVTVLSHNLSTNSATRAHWLATAASTFAEVRLIGPVERRGLWPALPPEPWISTVREKRFPDFCASFIELVEAAQGDVLVAHKPHLASFGVALVAAELRETPLILDIDDLDVALAPRSEWASNPAMPDLTRPASAVYLSLLTRAAGAASAITVASTALQQRFGGVLVPHGSDTRLFDPDRVDREAARRAFGFTGPTVLFAGKANGHKGLVPLAEAVARIPEARLAVTVRPKDLREPEWQRFPVHRVPFVPYSRLSELLAAADVIAVPQLEGEAARHQMPAKVYDAMAMAKPIVATWVSDMPSVLDGCGRLVPPGDADALAAAIAELVADPEEARTLGRRARERCLERYTFEQVGATLREVVQGVAP
jgi:glycosyltransferase involved in cell wall biosynthesis